MYVPVRYRTSYTMRHPAKNAARLESIKKSLSGHKGRCRTILPEFMIFLEKKKNRTEIRLESIYNFGPSASKADNLILASSVYQIDSIEDCISFMTTDV